jgi:hypothetical protein
MYTYEGPKQVQSLSTYLHAKTIVQGAFTTTIGYALTHLATCTPSKLQGV